MKASSLQDLPIQPRKFSFDQKPSKNGRKNKNPQQVKQTSLFFAIEFQCVCGWKLVDFRVVRIGANKIKHWMRDTIHCFVRCGVRTCSELSRPELALVVWLAGTCVGNGTRGVQQICVHGNHYLNVQEQMHSPKRLCASAGGTTP